jgi:hypothetical protein
MDHKTQVSTRYLTWVDQQVRVPRWPDYGVLSSGCALSQRRAASNGSITSCSATCALYQPSRTGYLKFLIDRSASRATQIADGVPKKYSAGFCANPDAESLRSVTAAPFRTSEMSYARSSGGGVPH